MEKPAVTEHPILELLARRWSPVIFADRPVSQPVLREIFEAARWSASSFNEQPWSYILGVRHEDPEQFDRLAGVLVPQNGWAKSAPVLALSVAKLRFTQHDMPNRVAFHDVGMASASMILQALTEDIFVHQMGGYDVEKARQTFAIPEGYDPVAMLALGYAGDPAGADKALQARQAGERTRKRVSEFVFQGNWGERGL